MITTRSEGEARLRILQKFLNEVDIPSNQFVMSEWGSRRGPKDSKRDLTLGECGTSACAAGWATTIPEFKKAGLQLVWYKPDRNDTFYADVRYNGYRSFMALSAFFRTPYMETQEIFSGITYGRRPTPKMVAARIARLLKEGLYD